MKALNHFILKKNLSLILCAVFLNACAYRWGNSDRSLLGGYKQVNIPMFKNYSQETGIEVAFTNSLVQEFERSKFARITEPQQAEVVIEGVIKTVIVTGTGKVDADKDAGLPTGTVMASAYDVNIVLALTVRRQSDKSVLWQGDFTRGRSYSAPQVKLAIINTVNPLYNLSARRQNIET